MQSITKGDVLQRMAGISFIVAAVLVMLVNILFPRASDPSNTRAWLETWAKAGSPFFQILSLLMAAGMWAMMIGTTGIYRSHTAGAAAAWTRLGFYGFLVGVSMWTVTATLQIGMVSLLQEWGKSAEPAKSSLFLAAFSLMEMENALFSMSVIVLWLALLFIGIGMILGKIYPKWSSWSLTILGILTVIFVGLPQTLAGLSSPVTNIFFPILAGLSMLWALASGIWLLRKAW